MTVLKYWDASQNQYVILGGGPQVAYTQVGATPPPTSAPSVNPPSGLLWVDTTMNPAATAAYVPPQAPPPSGFNSFTDAANEIWVSRNGSAWRKARDVLHCKVNRVAAWTLGTAAVTITFDTVVKDDYAIWNGGTNFVAPVAGWYATHLLVAAQIGSAFQLTLQAYRAAGATRIGYITDTISAAGGGWIGTLYQVNNYLSAAEAVQFNAQSSVAATNGGTNELCTAGMSYLGSG